MLPQWEEVGLLSKLNSLGRKGTLERPTGRWEKIFVIVRRWSDSALDRDY